MSDQKPNPGWNDMFSIDEREPGQKYYQITKTDGSIIKKDVNDIDNNNNVFWMIIPK